ncbi:MAG: ankyrin repeat domain-containing protein [Treponemataceae bacterium]|nr:ankyrin repeat domain-containing protein [Treponemataceae bacterium]
MASPYMLSEELLTAIQKHEIGIAEALISQGADVNYETLQGNTPLTFAIQANDMEMIKLLLKNGADAWKEVRTLMGGSINAINFARYAVRNEALARFLEYS